jgi:hypothetical protein
MIKWIPNGLVIIIFLSLVCGCDPMWPDAYWRSERYVLLAIDTDSQMSLYFDLQDGTALGLVGPTVFSIGENDKYIVVKQHPATDEFASSYNRSITNYFIIEKTKSRDFDARKKGVRGPIKADEFNKLVMSLSLPLFTKTFHNLE